MGALYQGLIVTGVLSIGAVWWVIHALVPHDGVQAIGDKTDHANGPVRLRPGRAWPSPR